MTKSLAFISMAVRNVIRNRQKTVTSVLGIILAVTLIFGEIISLELQSGAVLQHEMEEEDSHLNMRVYTTHENAWLQMRDIHEDIEEVEGIGEFNTQFSADILSSPIEPVVYLGDYNSSNESYVRFKGISGTMKSWDTPSAPDEGSIILSGILRQRFDLVVGQQINLTFSGIEHIYNESGGFVLLRETYFIRQYTIHGFWSSEKYYWDEPWNYHDYDDDYGLGSTIYLFGGDYLDVIKDITEGNTQDNVSHGFSLEFYYSSILDPSTYRKTSLTKARENADDVKRDLQEIVDDALESGRFHQIYLDSNYEYAFEDTEYYFDEIKWLLIALSIPIIIFGLYLGYLGIDLFLSERRREIGMLKARGATNHQLMTFLLTESLFLGAFAGALGIILAGYGSRAIMRFTQASSYVDIPWYDPLFTTGGLISAVILGMILMFASSIRLFRRVTRLEAGELLSKYSSKQEKPYNPSRDLKILTFAFVCLVAIQFFEVIEEISYSVDNIILALVLGVFTYLVVPFMVISAPYIIILIGVRIATRGSNRLFAKLAELAQLFTGELGYLIHRGITTGTRRIINLTTVLSVLFAFLILTSTFTFAQQDLEERIIKTEVGSDIHITFENRISTEDFHFFSENLTLIYGIDTFMSIFSTSSGFRIGNHHTTIIMVNSSRYPDIAYFDKDIFVEGGKDDVRSLRSGGAIISSDVADDQRFSRGNHFNLLRRTREHSGYGYGYTITQFGSIKVRGVMKTLPGIFGSHEEYYDNWILMDEDIFRDMVSAKGEEADNILDDLRTRYALVRTESSVDDANISQSIRQMQQFDIRSIRIASAEIEEMRTEPTSESFLLVLRTQLGVLVFISLLASGTVVFISSYEKRGERAAIMLRGTTGKQLYLLEFGEAMVILVYALLIGLITGLIGGAVWIFVFNVFGDLTVINRSYWPSFAMAPVIGIMIAIFLAAVMISTWKLKKIDLIRFMRWG